MICSRSVFAIGLLAFLTCCKPSESAKAPEPEWPTEQDIRKNVHGMSNTKITQIKKGAIYHSDGRLGPEGNLVFPIRVDYEEFGYNYQLHKNAWQSGQVEVEFYRNQFGEWLCD